MNLSVTNLDIACYFCHFNSPSQESGGIGSSWTRSLAKFRGSTNRARDFFRTTKLPVDRALNMCALKYGFEMLFLYLVLLEILIR